MFNYLQETSIFVMWFKKLRVISDVYEYSLVHNLFANLSRFLYVIFKYSIFGKPICIKGCDILSITEGSNFITLMIFFVGKWKNKVKIYIQNSITKLSFGRIENRLFHPVQWQELKRRSHFINKTHPFI